MSIGRWLIIASVIFTISIAAGTRISIDQSVLEYLFPAGTGSDPIFSNRGFMFIFILANNIIAVVFSFVLSPVLCLIPLISLVLNGLVIGFVSALVIEQQSLGFLIAGLLPHGIIEIPALILALGASLNFGFLFTSAILKRDRRSLIIPGLVENLKYLAIAVALLIPAAFIEAFITPIFLGLF